MKKLIAFFTMIFAGLNFAFSDSVKSETACGNETFVVSKNGSEVSVLCGGMLLSDHAKILSQTDFTNPTSVAVSFFISYLSQTEEWKDFVSDYELFISGGKESYVRNMKEQFVDRMNASYEKAYGVVDSISITFNPEKFKDGYYTVKIKISYNGESEEGEDQISMVKAPKSENWFVQELPL